MQYDWELIKDAVLLGVAAVGLDDEEEVHKELFELFVELAGVIETKLGKSYVAPKLVEIVEHLSIKYLKGDQQ